MNVLRPPWWIYVVAASFVATFALIFYLLIWGPAELKGIVATFADDAMVIQSLGADSEAAEGGLRAADRVLTIDGRPMRGPRDWTAATGNLEAGRAHRWVVSRDGNRVSLDIVPLRANVQRRLAEGYLQYLSLALSGFALGLLIAWKRPADPAARIGAWFLMTASIAYGFPQGWAVVWRELPAAAQWLLWIPQISRFVLEGIFLSFFVVFPRRLFTSRWPWFVLWAPVLATLPWRIAAFDAVIHSSQDTPVLAWILQLAAARTMVYLAAGIVVLAVSYRRIVDLNDRRRMRVLMAGTAVSVTSAMATVWLFSFKGQNLASWDLLFGVAVIPFNTACPLSFAYAILRHRVFDIQVIIRQGLQYAFARGAVVGLVPAMGAILVFDLVLNSQQPLADILRIRGWVYLAISGLALALYWQRKQWLETIDRRFFREQYDAQRLLGDVVEEIRAARSVERVSPRVVTRIEAALHPEFVSLMVRETNEVTFHPLASVPSGQAPSPLAADSKLVGLVSVLGKPLEVLLGDSDWLERRLPREEIDFLRRARIDLLVPITTAPGRAEALLVLGIKRSEEPYTRKDQELLEAIAASLALLREQPAPLAERSTGTFEIEEPHHAALKPTPVSDEATRGFPDDSMVGKVVSHYKVLRELGKEGMGEIFLAEDVLLERNVALKFLPDFMQTDPAARKRFVREAKAAAALDHPNICRIYEIGEVGGRAFIAMEYVDGQTLKDRLAQGALALKEVLQVAIQIAEALDEAHQKKIVHRDLKPSNIMLTFKGQVKVMDFGLAKRVQPEEEVDTEGQTVTGSLTQSGVTLGTLSYMSPEQLRGEKVDLRSDIFSFGIVFYEMIVRVHPFLQPRSMETAGAILYKDPFPLLQYVDNVPERLQQVVNKMLAKPAGERYQRIDDVRIDLRELSAQLHSTNWTRTAGSHEPTDPSVGGAAPGEPLGRS